MSNSSVQDHSFGISKCLFTDKGQSGASCCDTLRLRMRARLVASSFAADPMFVGGPHSWRAMQQVWEACLGRNTSFHTRLYRGLPPAN